ncbi:hypothetical protein IMX26_11785 [Clostridium sp. 'deep sea']|uniref:hypothetical protein n=1 Tax=Clostridium sp. 'deep sea' TaxID=2779445 RepID=UPI0018967643|nr:hypothetical protein [Clostridium sp. 'deep sea']QOR34168.1 hypothetical protein IMX26_11785 [Clostridium sp. 'deep sea']
MKKLISLTTAVLISVCLLSGCNGSKSSNANATDITTISGKITAINDNEITVKVLTGIHVESAIIIIEEATEYNTEVDHKFAKDNIIIFEVAKKLTDKNPINLVAKKIISNKPI